MQEEVFANQLLEKTLSHAQSLGATKVCGLYSRVLEPERISTEKLRLLFLEKAKGTLAEGADLEIETTTAKARCMSCDRISQPTPFTKICPFCGADRIEFLDQPGVEIVRLDVD